jgi:hypothetical protein
MALPKLDVATTKFFNDRKPQDAGELAITVAIYRNGKVELFGPDGVPDAEEVFVPINKDVKVIDFDSISVLHTTLATGTCWTTSTGVRKWWWI